MLSCKRSYHGDESSSLTVSTELRSEQANNEASYATRIHIQWLRIVLTSLPAWHQRVCTCQDEDLNKTKDERKERQSWAESELARFAIVDKLTNG